MADSAWRAAHCRRAAAATRKSVAKKSAKRGRPNFAGLAQMVAPVEASGHPKPAPREGHQTASTNERPGQRAERRHGIACGPVPHGGLRGCAAYRRGASGGKDMYDMVSGNNPSAIGRASVATGFGRETEQASPAGPNQESRESGGQVSGGRRLTPPRAVHDGSAMSTPIRRSKARTMRRKPAEQHRIG